MKQVEIELFEKTFTVGLPNAGQRMEIESRKQLFSSGLYGTFVKSDHEEARKLLNIIDAVSIFGILIPVANITYEQFKQLTFEDEVMWTKAFLKYYNWEQKVEQEIIEMFDAKQKPNAPTTTV